MLPGTDSVLLHVLQAMRMPHVFLIHAQATATASGCFLKQAGQLGQRYQRHNMATTCASITHQAGSLLVPQGVVPRIKPVGHLGHLRCSRHVIEINLTQAARASPQHYNPAYPAATVAQAIQDAAAASLCRVVTGNQPMNALRLSIWSTPSTGALL
jgi:hypothetical protein